MIIVSNHVCSILEKDLGLMENVYRKIIIMIVLNNNLKTVNHYYYELHSYYYFKGNDYNYWNYVMSRNCNGILVIAYESTYY